MSRKGKISLPREDFQIIIACIKKVMSRKGQISLRGQKYLERLCGYLFCLCQRRTDCAAAVKSNCKSDIVI